jgi:hypothetical protein
MRCVLAAVAFTLAFGISSAAPAAGSTVNPLIPLRTTTPPVIDGDLSDPVWREAPSVTGFKTWQPDFGQEPDGQTIVYLAYDAENIYFAFRNFDKEPDRIKASVAKRDTIRTDDWVCINLDPFGDKQSLYAFYINPRGIQADSRYAAGTEDLGFDLVWYSAGRIDAQGYTVEVRIPFKSLRYGAGNPVKMGVVFERRVNRLSEGTTYPPFDPRAGASAGAFLLQSVPIVFSDIRHYKLLEVLPDASYSRQSALSPGGRLGPASVGRDFGVSAKYGLTSQLMLDATANPDFSQIEADAGQVDVNLRYALFYPEKRPFFLEGNSFFNLGAWNEALQSVLHTRTIVNPIAGVKLSGRVARADSIGLLYAADELGATSAEDYAHFAVLRYVRAFAQDSYLGGFYTGRESGPSSNRVFGADGTYRIDQSSFMAFHALGSSTAPVTSDERKPGHALSLQYSRNTRNLGLDARVTDISSGFESHTGYLTRGGITVFEGRVSPRFYPRSPFVRRVQPSLGTRQTRDASSGIWETDSVAGLALVLPRAGRLSVLYRHASEVFRGRELSTSAAGVTGSVQWTKELRLAGSLARSNAIYYSANPFPGRSSAANLSLNYQPSEKLHQDLGFTYANFSQAASGELLYDYAIARSRTTYQVNRYLFFRNVLEYNSFRRRLLADVLGSFTYIPGTVMHIGYGSILERLPSEMLERPTYRRFTETRRGFFFKASYLWRL